MKIRPLHLIFAILFCRNLCAEQPSSEPILNGIMVVGNTSLAAIQFKGGPQRWCSVGDAIGSVQIKTIDAANNTVVVADPVGLTHEIHLVAGSVKDSASLGQKGLIPLNQLDWKWIKSDANPMKKIPDAIPDWAQRNWATLSDEQKIELKNYYRLYGWDAEWVPRSNGALHGSYHRLTDPNAPPMTPEQLAERARTAKPINQMPTKK